MTPEEIKAEAAKFTFSPEVIQAAEALESSSPSFDTLFEALRPAQESNSIADASLLLHGWLVGGGNLSDLVRYAHRNRNRADISPVLKWLHDELIDGGDRRARVEMEAGEEWWKNKLGEEDYDKRRQEASGDSRRDVLSWRERRPGG